MTRFVVAAVQSPHSASFDENLETMRRMMGLVQDAGADIAVLPEYFFVAGETPVLQLLEMRPRVHDFLSSASREFGVAVVANVVESFDGAVRNVGVAYDSGRLVGTQAKVHPMPREQAVGIQQGVGLAPFDVRGVSTGLLVCADILYPEAARVLALKGSQLLLNPVMSPYRESDETRAAREAVYVARAWDAGAFVVKAGGFRRESPRVAGRSLIASPWGMLARYHDDLSEELVTAELDFDRLATFRKDQSRFPERVPSAYRELAE